MFKLDINKETQNVIDWVSEYIKKTGAKGIVIGNSGGKDSATALAISVNAIRQGKCIFSIYAKSSK